MRGIRKIWEAYFIMKYLCKILFLIAFLMQFVNCSSDISKVETTEKKSIEENLKKYAIDFLNASMEIESEFLKNKNISEQYLFKNQLMKTQNEAEIITILEQANINNSRTIVNLIKKRIFLQSAFRADNKDFYKLDMQTRTTLFNNIYDKELNNFFTLQNTSSKLLSCAGTYNTTISRCNRTFGKCAAVAVIAAADGLIPGLVVGIFCAWDLSDCKDDAMADYESCLKI